MTSSFAFLPNVGVPELLIVLAIAILVLGPKRIPAAARSLGDGLRGFKDTVGGGDENESEPEELPEKTEVSEKSKTET